MSCSYGNKIKINIFGQSHSEAIGVVIDGLPPGEYIDLEKVQIFLDRRAPGKNNLSTPRKEADMAKVISGIFEGKTCGTPICAIIENNNTKSSDYEKLKDIPRPGHADFTAEV
ncbi:MAG: chorismate synthase, partial [Clostridioides sp.]|nr:chorismate synthase [Clostridioides sp.]